MMTILIKVYEMDDIYISRSPKGGKVRDAGDYKPDDCMPSYRTQLAENCWNWFKSHRPAKK